MKVFNKFEIIEPYPAVFVEDTDAVVIGDLHLGLEGIMIDEGFGIPKFQLDEIKEDIEEILENRKPEKLILLGDLKHKFGETSYPEWDEVNDLLDLIEKEVEQVIVTKGNHDNYLARVTSKREKTKLVDRYEIKDTLYAHGHDVNTFDFNKDYIILGHEHPALKLKGAVTSEKIKCFMYGELKDTKVLVIPAFSKIAMGSAVNTIPYQKFLIPILRDPNVKNFKAVGVGKEIGLLEFPKISRI